MEVKGNSVSGLGTSLFVPDLQLAFDIGAFDPKEAGNYNTVALTHGHMDHVHASAHMTSVRALQNMPPPHFILPVHLLAPFVTMFDAFRALDETDLPFTVTSVKPGDKVEVGRGLTLEVFEAAHRIPAVGYGVWKDVRKLKPEFVGKPGKELGDLRKQGAQLEDVVTTLVFAYTGDTRIEMFDANPVLYTAQTLAMEVTFFEPYGVQAAKEWGHTHLSEVIARADKFQNREVLFVHPSARYSRDEMDKVWPTLPGNLKNLCRWL